MNTFREDRHQQRYLCQRPLRPESVQWFPPPQTTTEDQQLLTQARSEKRARGSRFRQCSFILLSPLCEVIRILCQFFLLSLLIYILFCAEFKLIISVHKFIDTKGRVLLVNLHFEYKFKSTIQTKVVFHTIDNK